MNIQNFVQNRIAEIPDRAALSASLWDALRTKGAELTAHQVRVFTLAHDDVQGLLSHKMEALLKSALADPFKYTVIVGSVVDGFECYGVFDSEADATAWADPYLDESWSVMTICPKD